MWPDTRSERHPINLHLIDGSPNSAGPITDFVELPISITEIPDFQAPFLVTRLAPGFPIVLGLDFLRHHNPVIDWSAGTIRPKDPRPDEAEKEDILGLRIPGRLRPRYIITWK